MQLTKHQQDLLDGVYGQGASLAMQVQVGIGECFDARRLVRVTRAHVVLSAQEADVWFAEKLLDAGAACTVPPTVNPGYSLWRFVAADDPSGCMRRTHDAYKKLGAVLTYSCTPYLFDNIPVYGEVTAYSETSASIYVNSVIGARTNREGANSALCAAVTGYAPEYGMLLNENRLATVMVKVQAKLESEFDFALLGLLGEKVGKGVPVFTGIAPHMSTEALIALGTQLNVSGSFEMFHIAGVTPDAKTLEEALGSKQPRRSVTITEQDLERALEKYNSGDKDDIRFVMLGCPHYTYTQLAQAARLMQGARARVPVYILTSAAVMRLASDMGLLQTLEAAGCHVIEDTCVDQKACWGGLAGQTGMTDSPKCAYYTKTFGLNMQVADLSTCLRDAV